MSHFQILINPNNIFCGNLAVWQTSEQVLLAQHVSSICDMPMGSAGRFYQWDCYCLAIVNCSIFQHRWMHVEIFQNSTIYRKIILFIFFQKALLVTITIFCYNDQWPSSNIYVIFKNWEFDKHDRRILNIRYCLHFPQRSEWQLLFQTDPLNEDIVEVYFTWELRLSNTFLLNHFESLKIFFCLWSFLQPDLRNFLQSWMKTSWNPLSDL